MKYLKQKSHKEQINEQKMTERNIYEKFDSLGEEELNTKSNKNINTKIVIVTTFIKRGTVKKKRGIRAIDGFRKKLMIFRN